jgi:nitroreductase
MNVSDAIQTKRAVRQFQDKPLPPAAVRVILNAGRRSQSSKNTQPWHFIAVQDKSTLEALSKTGQYTGHIAGAALAVVILTPPPEERFSILFDAGQSASYIQLAAWEIGIGSCLATIYEPEKARQILGYPAGYEAHIAISLGYPLAPEKMNEPPKKGGRKSFDEVVHWEKW